MSNLDQINLLSTLFYIALIASIVFLILSFVLFFVFKIPQIYMMRTGKAQRKTIEQMKKINADTGRLSVRGQHERGISQIFGSSAELQAAGKTAMLMDPDAGSNTPVPEQHVDKFGETTLLYQSGVQIQPQTQPANGETTVLSQLIISEKATEVSRDAIPEPDSSYGKFNIVRYIIKIHTDEVIV